MVAHVVVMVPDTGWASRTRTSDLTPESESRTKQHSRGLVLLVTFIVLALVLVNIAQLLRPLDRDEGAFLTIAQEILHGRVPYRDVFDHKGPGIYYVTAGVLALCRGLPSWVVVAATRSLALVANLLTAYGLYKLGALWWRKTVGVVVACLWLLAPPVFQGDQLMTEPFAVAAVTGALALVAKQSLLVRVAAAGAAIGLGAIFKQTAILALPALLVLVCAPADDAAPPVRGGAFVARLGLKAAALLGGFCAPWLLVCGLFAAAGALGPMVEDVAMTSIAHYPADPATTIQSNIIMFFAVSPLVWAGAVAALAVWVSSAARRRCCGWTSGDARVVALALAAALNFVPFLSHAYLHYWLQVIPWAALLAATAIVRHFETSNAPEALHRRAHRLSRILGNAAFGSAAVISVAIQVRFASLVPDMYARLLDQQRTADLIVAHSSPGNALLIGPAEPEYYFLAGRQPTTTYPYLLPVNLTDSTVSQVLADVADGRFDVIAWQPQPYNVPGQPAYSRIQQVIEQRYRVVLMDLGSKIMIYQRTAPLPGEARPAP